MQITTLYWNVWLDNHIVSEERRRAVWHRLEELIDEYQPDAIGLNEVVTDDEKQPAPIMKVVEKQGFTAKYLPNIPLPDGKYMGNVLASKHPLLDYRLIDIGPNVVAEYHDGFKNRRVIHLLATIRLKPGYEFSFAVIHQLPLYPRAIIEHYYQQPPLAKAVSSPDLIQPVVFGGDFNELKYMPRSFYSTVKSAFHRKTGTYLQPTWLAYAIPWSPVRANYDHVYWSRNSDLIKLKSFKIVKDHPSDHAPLVAVFELNKHP